MEREFAAFEDILVKNEVEVLKPEPVGKFVYDQLTPRDIGVVIGNKFLVCNMRARSRRYECAGILSFLKDLKTSDEPNIIIPKSPKCFIEGGDLVIDKGHIFVCISQRTNKHGVEFLRKKFGDEFKIVPIKARTIKEGEDVLHLDCMFNPIGEKTALIYEEGFKKIPKQIENSYDHLIRVNKQEQQALATNVLSISKKKIISRNHVDCARVNERIRNGDEKGIEVIEMTFDAAPKTGGSFRCCSLPLIRD